MIFGENGTGKEDIADLLHDKSKRAGKPFVAVDCGSLSKSLHRRLSWDTSKVHLQVRTMPRKEISMRRKAARCFWTRKETSRWKPNRCCSAPYRRGGHRPVGDKADRNFNVRIIAATNEDLEVAVNEKRFRQDLLYRLHDFGITVSVA